MTAVECRGCGRAEGFHAPGCPANETFKPHAFDVSQHDAALASLRDAIRSAKALALSVASHQANFWSSSLVLAVERAEAEVLYYVDVEEKRRSDEVV